MLAAAAMDLGEKARTGRNIDEFGQGCEALPSRNQIVQHSPQSCASSHGQLVAGHLHNAGIGLHHQLVGAMGIVEPQEIPASDRVERPATPHCIADDL